MKNQFQHLTETQCSKLLNYYKNRIISMENLAPGNISNRLRIKREYKIDMFETIQST